MMFPLLLLTSRCNWLALTLSHGMMRRATHFHGGTRYSSVSGFVDVDFALARDMRASWGCLYYYGGRPIFKGRFLLSMVGDADAAF